MRKSVALIVGIEKLEKQIRDIVQNISVKSFYIDKDGFIKE